jgi:hypothetical protein
MVLLNAVVEILALADPNRFQSTSRAVLRSMCRVAGNNGFPVGSASVDDDAMGTAMTLQCLSKEALGRRQIPMETSKQTFLGYPTNACLDSFVFAEFFPKTGRPLLGTLLSGPRLWVTWPSIARVQRIGLE